MAQTGNRNSAFPLLSDRLLSEDNFPPVDAFGFGQDIPALIELSEGESS